MSSRQGSSIKRELEDYDSDPLKRIKNEFYIVENSTHFEGEEEEYYEVLDEYRDALENETPPAKKMNDREIMENLEDVMSGVINSLDKFENIILAMSDKLKARVKAQKAQNQQTVVNSTVERQDDYLEIHENIVTNEDSCITLKFPLKTVNELTKIEDDEYAEIAYSYISNIADEVGRQFQTVFRHIIADDLMQEVCWKQDSKSGKIPMQQFRLFSETFYNAVSGFVSLDEYLLELQKATFKANNRLTVKNNVNDSD